MASYNLNLDTDGVLRISFGDPAQNDQIVMDAARRLDELVKSGQISGGEVIRVNGPASLPAAMVIAHGLAHLYQAVACFDPKLKQYVVAIAHGDNYQVGNLLD
jgi:CRISPR-associated protein Csx3